MEYIKGKPYFCEEVTQIKQYPYLKQNLDCEILIIGGGIYGSIANFYLSKNHDIVLVDKGRIELDEFAEDLFKLFPNLKDKTEVEYKFCGSFGTTDNNMGLIGKSTLDDNLLLFISCGANGIINAMTGIELIEDILNNKQKNIPIYFHRKDKNKNYKTK